MKVYELVFHVHADGGPVLVYLSANNSAEAVSKALSGAPILADFYRLEVKDKPAGIIIAD